MRKRLFGGEIDFLTGAAILQRLHQDHGRGRHMLIGYHNLHTLSLHRRDKRLAGFYDRADLIYADGMPLILWGRFLGLPITRDHRMTLSSWAPEVLGRFRDHGWRLFYLGATKEACDKGVEAFKRLAPGLDVEARDGFFNAERHHPENQALIAEINRIKPDVLMIGMGTPRQELWINDNRRDLGTIPIIWSVGAAIEYFAGTKARPPAFVGRWGLEWLYRLLSEPTRLWHRYLVEPIFLVPLMLGDVRRRLQGQL